MQNTEIHERVWKTADGRYVADGHPDAAVLAAGPADRLPDDFDPSTFEPAHGALPAPQPDAVDDGDAAAPEPETEAADDDPADADDATAQEEPETEAATSAKGKRGAKR